MAVFPGNAWLAERLAGAKAGLTPARLHGFLRGAQAGPEEIEFGRVLEGASPACAGDPGLAAGLRFLWDATADAYRKGGTFPPAVSKHPATDKGNRALVEDVLDLCDGFVEGYELAGGRTGGEKGEGQGEDDPSPELEDLLDDLDLLLGSFDELDGEIGKEGIVKAQTRLLYQGLARLEDHFREVARASRDRALPSADPSAARKGARRLRRGQS